MSDERSLFFLWFCTHSISIFRTMFLIRHNWKSHVMDCEIVNNNQFLLYANFYDFWAVGSRQQSAAVAVEAHIIIINFAWNEYKHHASKSSIHANRIWNLWLRVHSGCQLCLSSPDAHGAIPVSVCERVLGAVFRAAHSCEVMGNWKDNYLFMVMFE